ncbi:MMPL family transporter [Streptomyces ficellus]|uniref:MMPL family transporter n=1 Tax=Streptomyces ficellus TaxID=1977088 RepID=A0A6I6FV83_9ACTN|nr:MMPL family transporter [Streptomyces ficellus]QGV81868.1 MMPL family transporter [Streptomyces ficellus]
MIRALTGFSTRRPWRVITVWAVVGILLALMGQALVFRVTHTDSAGFLPPEYDAAAALRVAREEFGAEPDANALTVLVARRDGKPLQGADRKRVEEVTRELNSARVEMPWTEEQVRGLSEDYSQVPRVTVVTTAPDGSFALLGARLRGNSTDPGLHSVYRAFHDRAEREFGEAGLRTGFTGGLADVVDGADAERTTQTVVGLVMVVLIVLINVLVFRSVLAAFVPLLAVSVVGGAATGTVVGAALLTGLELDPGTPSMIGTVLIGIGVDYFLFLLFRFREELRRRPEEHHRLVAADVAGRVGTAVTSAALTIVAAFATLGVATFGQFRVLGPSVAVSVLVMLVASLTLMPALLAVAGRKMFWPSRILSKTERTGPASRTGELVARRPLLVLLASAALLGALALGTAGVRMDFGTGGTPRDTAAAATAREIAGALPAGVSDPTTVYVTADDGRPLDPAGLDGLRRALSGVDGVGEVAAPVLGTGRDAARLDAYLTVDSRSQRARDLVAGPVRQAVREATPAGTTAHVGGTAAVFADVATAVDRDLRTVFPVAAALIALILVVLLRSLAAPVVLMLSVGLCFAATFGASVLVFQHLGGEPGVNFVLPLVLFLFVVALGTDYNILVSDRLREEMAHGGPARAAVARAVRHTAPAVATAGVVLAASFGSLAVNADASTRQLGFATALGILLSSFVLSLLLVPAAAALLGRGMWWPVRGARSRQDDIRSAGERNAGLPAPYEGEEPPRSRPVPDYPRKLNRT